MDREFLGRGKDRSTLAAWTGIGLAFWIGIGGSAAVSAEESTMSSEAQPARPAASSAIVSPQPDQPLSARWDWAVQQAGRLDAKRGVWIGYGVRRRMGANQFIGNWSSDARQWLSLNEVIYGERAPTDPRSAPQGNAKVWKTVGILMRF